MAQVASIPARINHKKEKGDSNSAENQDRLLKMTSTLHRITYTVPIYASSKTAARQQEKVFTAV